MSSRTTRFLLAVALMLACGCDPNTKTFEVAEKAVELGLETRNEAWVASALKAKYAEDFEVTEVNFEMGLNMYEFEAHPKRNPAVIFSGNFDERRETASQKLKQDAFVNASLSHAAQVHFDALVDPRWHRATGASVYSRHEHPFGNKVITLDGFLASRPARSTIRFNRYVFALPTSADDPLVEELRKNLVALQKKYGNDVSLYVGFWGPDFLQGRAPDDLSFGFEAKREHDADDLLTENAHLKRYLFVKITSGSVDGLSADKVFSLIKPRPTMGPMEMTEL